MFQCSRTSKLKEIAAFVFLGYIILQIMRYWSRFAKPTHTKNIFRDVRL